MPAFFLPGPNGWRDGKPASTLVPGKWPSSGKPPKVQKVPYTEDDDAALARSVAKHGEMRASFTRAVEAGIPTRLDVGICHGHNHVMESIRAQAEPRREVLGPRAALLNQAMIESSSGGDDGGDSDGERIGQPLNRQLLKGAKVAVAASAPPLVDLPDVGKRRRTPATSGEASLHAAHEDALAAWTQPTQPLFTSTKNFSPILLKKAREGSGLARALLERRARAVPTTHKAEVQAALRQLCQSADCLLIENCLRT
jgi:hypothetical protein